MLVAGETYERAGSGVFASIAGKFRIEQYNNIVQKSIPLVLLFSEVFFQLNIFKNK
jgi:hypothetical protein